MISDEPEQCEHRRAWLTGTAPSSGNRGQGRPTLACHAQLTRMPSKRAAMKDRDGSITASAKIWPCTLRSPMVSVSCGVRRALHMLGWRHVAASRAMQLPQALGPTASSCTLQACRTAAGKWETDTCRQQSPLTGSRTGGRRHNGNKRPAVDTEPHKALARVALPLRKPDRRPEQY